MVTNISVVNADDLITWEFNLPVFKESYPDLYEKCSDNLDQIDIYELEGIIPNPEHLIALILKEEAVSISLSDGTRVPIYNTDLIRFHGTYCDGYSIHADTHFVYFTLSLAAGQAGSLGIWSIEQRKFIFTNAGEGFCVENIIYLERGDCFLGVTDWSYPMSSLHGEDFFLISPDRKCVQIQVASMEVFNKQAFLKEPGIKRANRSNYILGFNEIQNSVYTIIGEELKAYKLISQVEKGVLHDFE